jgi:hypothetical protein
LISQQIQLYNLEYNLEDSSLFPFFISTLDTGVFKAGEALFFEDEARTLEEACAIAELRVIHGTRECRATIRPANVYHVMAKIRTYYWKDLTVVFRKGA